MSFHLITVQSFSNSTTGISFSVGFHVLNVGPQGPAGGTGNDLTLPFSWGDAYPIIIGNLPANKLLLTIQVVITTAFNTTSTLSIGTDANNTQFSQLDQVDLTTIGTYEINPNLFYGSNTVIKVFLNLIGGNTTGAGTIFINIQE